MNASNSLLEGVDQSREAFALFRERKHLEQAVVEKELK